MPFYNCHIHVFSAECAPEQFLKVGDNWFLRNFSKPVKSMLETKIGRAIVKGLSRMQSRSGAINTMSRYGSFASVGTMSTQKLVFKNILNYYPADARFVVLTLNMDYMGAGKADLNFQGQVDQVVQLRTEYADACLPFLSIDPRMSNRPQAILDFVQRYIGPQKPFVGIKVYPSLGYFPYDNRLELMYEYCEANGVPIMTHCDPGGSFFLGTIDALMGCPGCISYNGYSPGPVSFKPKNNNKETERFLEPHAWDVVLAKWPNLKVCFAHMGGSDALNYKLTEHPKENEDSSLRWFLDIKDLMAAYPNVYTDVSYTLHNQKNWPFILNTLQAKPDQDRQPRFSDPRVFKEAHFQQTLKDRIIFGTDYFMTEREKSEQILATELPAWLLREKKDGTFRDGGKILYEALTEKNPEAYLTSAFYKP